MSLDFGQTCPDIDDHIDKVKQGLKDLFDEVIRDVSPRVPDEIVEEMAGNYADYAWELAEDEFEGVRKTNEYMREAADYQISLLEDQIEDLKQTGAAA